MTLYRIKHFAPIALFVATLSVFGNFTHALEHDLGASLGQNHAECVHCSIDAGTDAQVGQPVFVLERDVFGARWVASGFVAPVISSFKARAPPLS